MGKFPIKVIPNGIDLNKFKPTRSDFRKKYNLENKFIILGVSSSWVKSKGIDDFIEISKQLEDKYQIILVGLTKKQKDLLPNNIMGITHTDNVEQLAALYTVADVFVNPTYEDNFPTTNLEALACGTPVITYKTGGSIESIDENCGMVIEQGDLIQLVSVLRNMKNNKFSEEECLKRSKIFSKEDKYNDYINVYKELI